MYLLGVKPKLAAIFKKIAAAPVSYGRQPDRLATCGACGTEREVSPHMFRYREEYQFTPRPKEPTDSFYCGCQHDPWWYG